MSFLESTAQECSILYENALETGGIQIISPAYGQEHLIGAENGLYSLKGGNLTSISSTEQFAEVTSFGLDIDGVFLIGTDSGLYFLKDGKIKNINIEAPTGYIHSIGAEYRGNQFIIAENGLYLLQGLELSLISPSNRTEYIYAISPEYNDSHLIISSNGLFVMKGRTTLTTLSDLKTGRVIGFGPDDSGMPTIVASNGLFSFNGEELLSPKFDLEIGEIFDYGFDKNRNLLIHASNGLFNLVEKKMIHIESEIEFSDIQEFGPKYFDGQLIGAEGGLFLLNHGEISQIDPTVNTGGILKFGPKIMEKQLVEAHNGLFLLDKNKLKKVKSDFEFGFIEEFGPEFSNGILLDTLMGLFILREEEISDIYSSDYIGSTNIFGPRYENTQLVGGENGFFQIIRANYSMASKTSNSVAVEENSSIQIEWFLKSNCGPVILQNSEFYRKYLSIEVNNKIIDAPLNIIPVTAGYDGEANFRVEASIEINSEQGDELQVKLLHNNSDDEENFQAIPDSEYRITVNWSTLDHILYFAKKNTLSIIFIHTLIFLALLLGARHSAWAWRTLSDPFLSKVGVWFWFLIRNSAKVQRYFLERWYLNTTDCLQKRQYLPIILKNSENSKTQSDGLVNLIRARCRIWIQGKAGMGKTALANDIQTSYFVNDSSLSEMYEKYGYIPIFITLRDYIDVAVPSRSPENWLIDIVARQMEHLQLGFKDQSLLRSVLKSGNIVLVLDGENEIDHKGAIFQFALRYPETGLVITSQVLPDQMNNIFQIWRLPDVITDVVDDLLKLYLGKKNGTEVFSDIKNSMILKDIRSGYDVRLLVDLIDGGTGIIDLPSNRIGLYDAMLAKISPTSSFQHFISDLCSLAWNLWMEGQRTFEPSSSISNEIFNALRMEDVKIIHTYDGVKWQFRHDEMRGYLAARWVAKYEVDPISLFEDNSKIWRIGKSDQQLVWSFFSELIEKKQCDAIMNWASIEPERAELQVILRRRSST